MKKWTSAHRHPAVDLPDLLDSLPMQIEALGFRFYTFTFTSDHHRDVITNYPARWIEHYDRHGYAAIDPVALHCKASSFPLLWHEQTYSSTPEIWAEAQACGLSHGWVQPNHDQQTHSSLSVVRPHVSVSTQELYEKAHLVMQLGEQLHTALRCADRTCRRLSQQLQRKR